MSPRHQILVAFLAMAASTPASAGPKFGPAQIADLAHQNPGETYHFIVRGAAAGLAAAKQEAASPATAAALPVIDGEMLQLKESDAEALEARADVTQVYYVPSTLADTYVHVIEGLAYAYKTAPAPGVVNMSLGPDNNIMPVATQADDPMNLATRKLADKGFVIVMAIGNYFTNDAPNPGVTNPWCRVEWVVCVGAVSADAKILFEQSARGAPADPTTWPDVVADGIDVLSDWPPELAKSSLQQAQDQSSAAWRALPAAKQASYAVMNGTSQATAQVSRAAAQIIYFFQHAAEAAQASGGSVIFALDIPQAQFDAVSRRGPRLTGDVSHPSADVVEVTYRLDQPWKIVKQILIDTATPLAGFTPEEVGAGFVSPDFIDAEFGHFQVGEPRILPVKVIP